jgi:uncharacterized protein (DUF1778 family)
VDFNEVGSAAVGSNLSNFIVNATWRNAKNGFIIIDPSLTSARQGIAGV